MGLYPFQQEGADWLTANPRAYLGDQMRLGKTIQSATAAKQVGVGNALVITPASAVENWRREWTVWGPEANLGVMSWADPRLKDVRGADWDLVILDEAHYAKSPTALRTKRALRIAAAAGSCWPLSGTPMPNHPGELYPIIAQVWPEIPKELGIKSYQHWMNKFCVMRDTPWGPKPVALKNPEILGPLLKRFMRRRTLDEVGLELPPLDVQVSLLPRDGSFDRALREIGTDAGRLERLMEGEEKEGGSLSRLRRLLGQYKAPRIGQQLSQELEDRAYHKIVVMAHHRDVLDTLRSVLGPFGVVGFDGSTPRARRQEAIDEFREGTARVFLGQQSAAGIAINLAAADEIVLVEPAWTPAENAQALLRVRDIGKKRPVRGRVFGVAGTLDEGLMGAVVRKAKMQRELGL